MLASFVSSSNPKKVWIGDIKRNGKDHWLVWQKQQAHLSYTFKQDCERLAGLLEEKQCTFNSLFETVGGHPILLKCFIKRQICLETLIILDLILGYMSQWDRELHDPLWEDISFKIKKYKPFLSINTMKFRPLVKEAFL